MAEQSLPGRTPPGEVSLAPSAVAADARAWIPQLVLEHHAAVYRYAFRLCGIVADAEDLTQQTFLVAQERIHQLRDRDKALPWLLAVVRNGYLKSLRNSQIVSSPHDLDLQPGFNESDDGPLDREQIQRAIQELPTEFRLVLLMFYFEELAYKEIAAQLEIPVGTVMSRLSRAKALLKHSLHMYKQPALPVATH